MASTTTETEKQASSFPVSLVVWGSQLSTHMHSGQLRYRKFPVRTASLLRGNTCRPTCTTGTIVGHVPLLGHSTLVLNGPGRCAWRIIFPPTSTLIGEGDPHAHCPSPYEIAA